MQEIGVRLDIYRASLNVLNANGLMLCWKYIVFCFFFGWGVQYMSKLYEITGVKKITEGIQFMLKAGSLFLNSKYQNI